VLANLEKAEFNERGEPVASPSIRHRDGEGSGGVRPGAAAAADAPEPQLGLFASREGLLAQQLANLDLDGMTPLDAMNKLAELKKKAEGKS
jgi:hypothetical protein